MAKSNPINEDAGNETTNFNKFTKLWFPHF